MKTSTKIVLVGASIATIISMATYKRAPSTTEVLNNLGIQQQQTDYNNLPQASSWELELPDDAKDRLKNFDDIAAYTAAEDFVKGILISPSSADFVPPFSPGVAKINDTTWSVQGKVDSQNEFGAMLRKEFVCHLTYDPIKDVAHCSSVKIIN